MIDRTHAGVRCHTRRMLRTVKGNLPRESLGTVVYEMDNLGRHFNDSSNAFASLRSAVSNPSVNQP